MKTWTLMLAVSLFAAACAKDKAPENAGSAAVETTLVGMLDINRKPNPEGQDQRWVNTSVEISNPLGGPITVNKIDWKVMVGAQDLGSSSMDVGEQIAAGGKGSFKLSKEFTWKDETGLRDDAAQVTGTVTWTGPKGNTNTTPFTLNGKVKHDEAADIEKPAEGAGGGTP